MSINIKKILFFSVLVIALFLLVGRFTLFFLESKVNKTIGVNGVKVSAEVVGKPEDLYKGLSNRDSICADCGMLFNFGHSSKQTFWMRDMKFPLDIIWISGNKIIKIDANLPPAGHNPSELYKSGQPVDYVLEVNGGFADKNNIKVGDIIK